MRTELLVFAALLGYAFADLLTDRIDFGDLGDLERIPPNLRLPIRHWPPIGWPVKKCHAQSGGWSYESLPADKWPTSGNPSVFYVGCKVWRPTWSSCSGSCESSQNITSSASRPKNECTCCRSASTYSVRPYPRCWVIRINNGAFGSGKFETVRQRVDYWYNAVSKCDCRGCLGRFPPIFWRGRGEDLSEDDVTGRPAPPTPSVAERTTDLAIAARRIPGLRGLLQA